MVLNAEAAVAESGLYVAREDETDMSFVADESAISATAEILLRSEVALFACIPLLEMKVLSRDRFRAILRFTF